MLIVSEEDEELFVLEAKTDLSGAFLQLSCVDTVNLYSKGGSTSKEGAVKKMTYGEPPSIAGDAVHTQLVKTF